MTTATTQPVLRANYEVFPYVGASVPCDATRIDKACFRDGNEDEIIIEFWYMSGSILRTSYDRHTGATERRFICVHTWEFRKLQKMAMTVLEYSWGEIWF